MAVLSNGVAQSTSFETNLWFAHKTTYDGDRVPKRVKIMAGSEYRKNNLNGCFYDMKAQSKHFWNKIYRVRKNAMRLRVARYEVTAW